MASLSALIGTDFTDQNNGDYLLKRTEKSIMKDKSRELQVQRTSSPTPTLFLSIHTVLIFKHTYIPI